MKAKKVVLRREGEEELRNLVPSGEKAFSEHELSWVAKKGTNSRDFRRWDKRGHSIQ